MFRIGPAAGPCLEALTAHPGQQFPVEAFEAFVAQWVPRWADHEAMTLQAYEAMLERVGPCMLVAHSQGGGLALTLAARRPELFKAVVAVEPSGAPEEIPSATQRPPCLMVWGDYVQGHPVWRGYRARVEQHFTQLRAQGATAATLDLPGQGIPGNSHFPMLDRNSDEVIDRILQWLNPLIPQITRSK